MCGVNCKDRWTNEQCFYELCGDDEGVLWRIFKIKSRSVAGTPVNISSFKNGGGDESSMQSHHI